MIKWKSIILEGLRDLALDLHLMANAGDMKNDIYTLHMQFTKNIVMQDPRDDCYLMDDQGEIVFIGNQTTLINFIRKSIKSLRGIS